MSAKWRALQHRHRYTYNSIVFPQSYRESLDLLSSEISCLNFFIELKELISLNSVYSQVNAVKKVAVAFSSVLSTGSDAIVDLVVRFYLEILFIENSLPLHRTVISILAKGSESQTVISSCFQSLVDEYVTKRKNKFLVSRVALSLLSFPKLGFLAEVIGECSATVALDAVVDLNAVISEINGGLLPSPIALEQCQEALSCLYYLLQRFPSKFSCYIHPNDLKTDNLTVIESVVLVILEILKSSAFSRDCLVAAGVSFCAALQTFLSPREICTFIAEGFFGLNVCNHMYLEGNEIEPLCLNVLPNVDFYTEIRQLSFLSSLCFLRGILTAVPREVLNSRFQESTKDISNLINDQSFAGSNWTILFNGILPKLYYYCENSTDSHFNFHALTVTQICLQQMKTSVLTKLTVISDDYNPFPEDMGNRILRIIWNNLEDSLSQTVKQVHLIFDLFLDIKSIIYSMTTPERTKPFFQKMASDLLRLGWRCKGRYVPLAALTTRLGAKNLLDMNPNLISEVVQSYIDDDVCCSATSFLKRFLECLRDECWSSKGVEKGYINFRELCLPHILNGLVSGVTKLRSNLNTYAISVVLDVDADSIFPMLAFISIDQGEKENCVVHPKLASPGKELTVEQRVAAMVSLLKVSRSLALIEGDIDFCEPSLELHCQGGLINKNLDSLALVSIKGIPAKIPVRWLLLALTHADDTLRIDAAELLFLNPKTASLPSLLELNLMREAVPLNMRCCSTAFLMKWTSMFRKFFSRVRTAMERQVKQGSWLPLPCSRSIKVLKDNDENGKIMIQRAEELFHFMKWLSGFLLFSVYPSAPYERKTMAMELILIMINTWPVTPADETDSSSSSKCMYPYCNGFILPDSTLSLVGSIIDSWDRLRESAFRILLHFPSPLPGISSEDSVKNAIIWAKKLVCSPRVRESDAGALTLRLLFKKYVLDLGWIIHASDKIVCFQPQSQPLHDNVKAPVVEYIHSLVDWLHVSVEEGENDLSEACKNSFVHGVLLTLRYSFEELDWNSNEILSNSSEMKNIIGSLFELILRISSLALWVVSAGAWSLPEDMDDMAENGVLDPDLSFEEEPELSPDLSSKDSEFAYRQPEQVVMVGCWLAMKEVSLLLGTIIRKIPLPDMSFTAISGDQNLTSELQPIKVPPAMLDLDQLEVIGNHFLEVLLKTKHNGAVDKTRAGFTALCHRLLCSNDPRLCRMPELWMEQLMIRILAKGQTVDDLLRRSAGIPAAFIAFFLSEPEGAPKKLLPRALHWLMNVANTSLRDPTKINSEKHGHESMTRAAPQLDVNDGMSKVRDEGVIPTVHAFNVLRASFNDTNLAVDTSGFSAETLIIAVRSFSSPYWEVRNSACLAYTALVRRMLGFLNIQKRESARRALTGLEFFHRYPTLHPFLLSELKIATSMLEVGSTQPLESNMVKVVHPSLCPILILLCRLKPSAVSTGIEDPLDPFLFMPSIRKCSIQSNLRVRVLASRALTGLVSSDKLHYVLESIVCELPQSRWTDSQRTMLAFKDRSLLSASFNSIHGTLLQISALLDNNCRNLTDITKKTQIIDMLVKVLENCSWLGSTRLCPCPTINGSYLQVIDYILDIIQSCGLVQCPKSIRKLLLASSSECLERVDISDVAFYDPTRSELRKKAAMSYFSCHFDKPLLVDTEGAPTLISSPPRSEDRLLFCISDSSYEVRHATLKMLFRILKCNYSDGSNNESDLNNGCIHRWAKTNLQFTMMTLLSKEQNCKCIYYILRIIFLWNMLQFQKLASRQLTETVYVGGMDYESVINFYDKLVSLNKEKKQAKIKQALLCCMGMCIRRFSVLLVSSFCDDPGALMYGFDNHFLLEKWTDIRSCLNSFTTLIIKYSVTSETVNMRKAAADSMIASGLLKQAIFVSSVLSNYQNPFVSLTICKDKENPKFESIRVIHSYACTVLDFWFTCIRLLEDEDSELHQKLAIDVQECFQFHNKGGSFQGIIVPTQVEVVIKLSFGFLSSMFGHWNEYINHLLRYILNTCSSDKASGNLVRRVFDKEIDNHHEEKLLICQICCLELEKLLFSSENINKRDFQVLVQEWRLKFSEKLISSAKEHHDSSDENDWIGGLGNHKDAFIVLYANLLGLYALSNHSPSDHNPTKESSKSLLSTFAEFKGIIGPFLSSPLISNLYLLVIQSHERMLGVSLHYCYPETGGDHSAWEDFDPYFLLGRY